MMITWQLIWLANRYKAGCIERR